MSGDRVDQMVSRPLREMGSEDFASQPCSSAGRVGAAVKRPVEGLMHLLSLQGVTKEMYANF